MEESRRPTTEDQEMGPPRYTWCLVLVHSKRPLTLTQHRRPFASPRLASPHLTFAPHASQRLQALRHSSSALSTP